MNPDWLNKRPEEDSDHPYHSIPDDWSPGHHGKGLLWPNGRDISAWAVDEHGNPHHIDFQETVHIPGQFMIFPDGNVQPVWGDHGPTEEQRQLLFNRGLKWAPVENYDYDPFEPNEWKFGSTEHHNWTPGNHGKGMLLADGSPVTWNLTDDEDAIGHGMAYWGPHHREVAEHMGLSYDPQGYEEFDGYDPDEEKYDWHTPVYITPEGEVHELDFWPNAEAKSLEPFYNVGLKSDEQPDKQQWKFGTQTPPIPVDPDEFRSAIELKNGEFVSFDTNIYTHAEFMHENGYTPDDVIGYWGYSPVDKVWTNYAPQYAGAYRQIYNDIKNDYEKAEWKFAMERVPTDKAMEVIKNYEKPLQQDVLRIIRPDLMDRVKTPEPRTVTPSHAEWLGQCPNCGAKGKWVRAYGYLGQDRDCLKCKHEWVVPVNFPEPEQSPPPSPDLTFFDGQYEAQKHDSDADRPNRHPFIYVPSLNHVYVGKGGTSHHHLHDEFPYLDNHEDEMIMGGISKTNNTAFAYSPDMDDATMDAIGKRHGVNPLRNEYGY